MWIDDGRPGPWPDAERLKDIRHQFTNEGSTAGRRRLKPRSGQSACPP